MISKAHNKTAKKRGFGSTNYDPAKKRAAQAKGGSVKVAKGFAKMTPEMIRAIASKGGKS